MANSRETLTFLITEKTDMDIAQASAYVSKIIEDIDEKSVEDFLKGMVRAVGRSDIGKFDAVGLNNIVQEIISKQNVHTKQQIATSERETKEKQEREDNFVKEYIEASQEKPAKDTAENQNTFEDYENTISNIPDKYRKVNEQELNKIKAELSAIMQNAEPEVIDAAARAVELSRRCENLKNDTTNTKSPEEKRKETEALIIEADARDIFGEEKPSKEKYQILQRAAAKDIEQAEKEENTLEKRNMSATEASIRRRIERIQSMIKDYEKLLQDKPDDMNYRKELLLLRAKLRLHEKGLEQYREGKESKEGFLDPKKTVKNSAGRKKEIESQINESIAITEELTAEFKAETDPEKKEAIRIRLIKEHINLRNYRKRMEFETVYGQALDKHLIYDMQVMENKGGFNEKKSIESFEKKYRNDREEQERIKKLREELKSPGITPEERMSTLVRMANAQEAVFEKMELLGFSKDHAMNILQKCEPLTAEEWLEVEEHRIKNKSKTSDTLKKAQLQSVQVVRESLDRFEDDIKTLQEKGYTDKEIILFLSTMQNVRAERESFLGVKTRVGIAKEDFVRRMTTKAKDAPYGKKVIQMASEFASLYEGREEDLITLSVSEYGAVTQCISSQREMLLEKSKANQLANITRGVSQQELGAVTAEIKETETRLNSPGIDRNETQTPGEIEVE